MVGFAVAMVGFAVAIPTLRSKNCQDRATIFGEVL